MESELLIKLEIVESKLDAVYKSTEKTRKMILWTGIISLAFFVLPLIGLVFAVPSFLSYYSGISGNAGAGMGL